MSPRLKAILAIVLPLFVGVGMYWLFRGVSIIHVGPLLTIDNSSAPQRFMAFNLPDGLWLYALLQGLRAIWGAQLLSSRGAKWLIVAIGLAFGSEVGQYFRLVPGTFDPLDLVAYSGASILFLLPLSRYPAHPKAIII